MTGSGSLVLCLPVGQVREGRGPSLSLRSCEPRNEKKKAWLQHFEGQAQKTLTPPP
jgi:hypothetical protein